MHWKPKSESDIPKIQSEPWYTFASLLGSISLMEWLHRYAKAHLHERKMNHSTL